MNEQVKGYFEQLIEDREYTNCTGPAPTFVVAAYINQLETLVKLTRGDFDVVIEKGYVAVKMK